MTSIRDTRVPALTPARAVAASLIALALPLVGTPALANASWDHYRVKTKDGPVKVTVQVNSDRARFLIYRPNSDYGHCFAGGHLKGTPWGYYTGYNYRPSNGHGRSLGRAEYWIQRRSDGTLRLANKYAPFDWIMRPVASGYAYPKRYCPPLSWTR